MVRIAAVLLSLATLAHAGEPIHTASYAVHMMDRRVGEASFSVWEEGDKYRSESNSVFALTQMGATRSFVFKAKTSVRRVDSFPVSYSVDVDLGGAPGGVNLTCTGAKAKATLSGAFGSGTKDLVLPTDTVLLDNNFLLDHYWFLLKKLDLASDKPQAVRIFVPQALANLAGTMGMTCTVEGPRELELPTGVRTATEVRCLTDTGVTMYLWADADGPTLLKLDVPAQRSSAVIEEAAEEKREGAVEPASLDEIEAEMVEQLFIPAGWGDGRDTAALRVRLNCGVKVVTAGSGAEAMWAEAATDARGQSFDGEVTGGRAAMLRRTSGLIAVEAVEYAGEGAADYPIRGAPGVDARFLRPSWRVESEHEEIRAKARELTAGASTAWEAAAAIGRFVAGSTRYELTGGSALDCLKSGEGDCGPQALLVVALCRAAGVPARLCGGLVFTSGRFAQHNWAEVYCGERVGWVPMDTTTNEVGAFSASHITLWHGAGALDTQGVNTADLLLLERSPSPPSPSSP